eukprot:2541621-Rhodomonas_salina.2
MDLVLLLYWAYGPTRTYVIVLTWAYGPGTDTARCYLAQVHPKTVVTTGSLYEVREGDFLERLGRRFLVRTYSFWAVVT